MKKVLIALLSLFIGIVIGSFLWFYFVHKIELPNVYGFKKDGTISSTDQIKSKKYSIAIVTPALIRSLEAIEDGFKESLLRKYGLSCVFTTYNANGNRTLMRSQLEDIVQKDFDAIFTIGAMASQMAKEVTTKRGILKPIVFGAVADPIRLDLVNAIDSSGNHLTGSATTTDYPNQINFLLQLKKNIKNVLLIYDPTQSSGLEHNKNEVIKLLQERNIIGKAVEIYHTREINQKIEGLITGVDVVIIFKDATVVSGIDALIKLCSRYGVTLMVSDLDSVDKGACLGFGVHEYDFGAVSADLMVTILREKKQPDEIPVSFVKNFRLKINTKTMKSQGLVIEHNLLELLKVVEIV